MIFVGVPMYQEKALLWAFSVIVKLWRSYCVDLHPRVGEQLAAAAPGLARVQVREGDGGGHLRHAVTLPEPGIITSSSSSSSHDTVSGVHDMPISSPDMRSLLEELVDQSWTSRSCSHHHLYTETSYNGNDVKYNQLYFGDYSQFWGMQGGPGWPWGALPGRPPGAGPTAGWWGGAWPAAAGTLYCILLLYYCIIQGHSVRMFSVRGLITRYF